MRTPCKNCAASGARAVVTLLKKDLSSIDFVLQPPDGCLWRDPRLKFEMVTAQDFVALEVRVSDLEVISHVYYTPGRAGFVSDLEGEERAVKSLSCEDDSQWLEDR